MPVTRTCHLQRFHGNHPRGDNHNHIVHYKEGCWACNCPFFESRNWCAHTMAMQKILGVMLPEDDRGEDLDPDAP